MFWPLLLSHLIADYPLQTDAMVVAKKTRTGLTAHVAVHLLTMVVIMLGILKADWTALWYILAVAIFHFGIDTWKNIFSNWKPAWVIRGYLQDQVLHLISLLCVAYAGSLIQDQSVFAIRPLWVLAGIGYVLATHAAYVTERVISYQHKDYQQWVAAQFWPRMMRRAVLFSAFLLGLNVWGATAAVGSVLLSWYDLGGQYRWRALVIDGGIVLVTVLLIL